MTKKLPTTPNGIICSCCGHDKDPYEFFRYINKYDRKFFAAGIPPKSDVCWACAGPYVCITCKQTKDASQFRVQGRICVTCKTAPRTSTPAQLRVFDAIQVSEVVNAENSLKR